MGVLVSMARSHLSHTGHVNRSSGKCRCFFSYTDQATPMPCGKRIFRTAAGRKENFSHGPCVWRSIYYSLFRQTGTLRYVAIPHRIEKAK